MIYNRRGWEVYIKEKMLSINWDGYGQKKGYDNPVTYHLSTSNISDSITDNNYLSSALSNISVKVSTFLPVYILLLV